MRPSRRTTLLAAVALALAPLPALASASSTTRPAEPPRLQPWLSDVLRTASADRPLRVMVSAESTSAASAAVRAAGLRVQQTWNSVGVVVAIGLPAQVRKVSTHAGVQYVEGDQPMTYTLDTVHRATRSDVALASQRTTKGQRVDGLGVSIAVIDSGIDATHPFFKGKDGKSKVVVNLKDTCTQFTSSSGDCFFADPSGDSDTSSVGGHGTHVAGIAAGVETQTTGATPLRLRGAAPGATLIGLSAGAGLLLTNVVGAQNWVLEHQKRPCRAAKDQDGPIEPACPPIRVTNHSYGPARPAEGGNRFDEFSAAVRIQRALVEKGVVAVWAAGNSAGNGSIATTNPPGMDPTPGILMVANYSDRQAGDRDNRLSASSSRGKLGDRTTYPDLSAPGDRITSSCRPYLAVCSTGLVPKDGPGPADVATFNTISGTSMAAPYIAGVVAQLFQLNPRLTPGQVEQILENTAHRFTEGGDYQRDEPGLNRRTPTSFDKGHGLVDVQAALTAARKAR